MTAIELACGNPLQSDIHPMRLMFMRSRQTATQSMPDWQGSDRFSKPFLHFIAGIYLFVTAASLLLLVSIR
jgi:hypothetical protein